uniref:Uncharacterized protein n=1 Tax=Arundo donax TaxID=35708 RepID=A0A0A9AA10_ARUDO
MHLVAEKTESFLSYWAQRQLETGPINSCRLADL